MQRAQLRTATQTRRSARTGFPEPDDFEGLPVRQWRQEWVNVAPTLQQEMTRQGDRWAVELPYGMPRESHLLPPHTQELLRAARSGRLYKRPAPAEEEEPDVEVDAAKGEKKEWEPPSEGYMVKMWKQVPRNAESQTVSHLAKRHKKTVTLASKAAAPTVAGPTVTRATVRRIDAAGNPYEQTVTLSEGQHVDGEIISTTVVPALSAAAPGELPIQQATPVRRRPPPPKRKPKGIGRGRKKGKLPLPLPATRSHATTADGAPIKQEGVGADGIKIEDTEDSGNQDSEMADVSGMPSEDEEGDAVEGEDGEEGDEEGVEDDEAIETPNAESTHSLDAPGLETADSEMSEVLQPTSIEEPDEPGPVTEEVEEVTIPKVRFQPPPLGAVGTSPLASAKIEGSPLKNVMILSPTEPSRLVSPQGPSAAFAASNHLDVQSQTASLAADQDETVSQAYIAETTVQEGIPALVDEAATAAEQDSTAQPTDETPPPAADADVEMADTTIATDVPNQPEAAASPSAVSQPDDTIPPMATDETPAPPSATSVPATVEPTPDLETTTETTTQPDQPDQPPAPSFLSTPQTEIPAPAPAFASETPLPPAPPSPTLAPVSAGAGVGGDDEDEGLNLLGSLERELDRQQGVSSGSASAVEGEGKGTPDVAAGIVGAGVEREEIEGQGASVPEVDAPPSALEASPEAVAAGGEGGEEGDVADAGGDDATAGGAAVDEAAAAAADDAAEVDTTTGVDVGDAGAGTAARAGLDEEQPAS